MSAVIRRKSARGGSKSTRLILASNAVLRRGVEVAASRSIREGVRLVRQFAGSQLDNVVAAK